MTSIEKLLGSAPELPEVARIVAGHCGEIFDRRLIRVDAGSLELKTA